MKPLLDVVLGGAAVGVALRFAPQQYNTPMTRLLVGAAATYMGSGYIRDAGKVLIGMEVARITGNMAGGMTTPGSSISASTPMY